MILSVLKPERAFRCRRRWPRHNALCAALLALVSIAALAPAQSTWNSSADGNWSIGPNWLGGVAPTSAAGTALIFGAPAIQTASYTATNDIANPFLLNSLAFNNTSGVVTLAGSPLSFAGTNPTLMQSGAGSAVVELPVTLAATTTVAGTGTGSVTINGAVNGGTINLVKSSEGSLTLAGGGSLNVL